MDIPHADPADACRDWRDALHEQDHGVEEALPSVT
jgi:hypothetical protein